MFGLSDRQQWLAVGGVLAILAAWMGFGTLHAFQHSDSFLPVLVSTQHWTPFFWGQDRFGMLIPLLAMPVRDPLANLLAQGWVMTLAALAAPFAVARFLGRHTSGWVAIGAVTNVLLLGLTPHAVHFDWLVAQPYGLSIFLGFAGLLVVTDDSSWRSAAALALLSLACWVNLGIAVMLAIAAIAVGPRRARLLTFVILAAALGLLLSRYLATVHTVASLVAVRQWPVAWYRLSENALGVVDSRRAAIAVGICVAVIVAWLRMIGRPMTGHPIAVAVLACGITFVVGTSLWVEMNGYSARYMYPTLMLAGLGASTVFVALLARWTAGVSVVALAVLTVITVMRFGAPSLERIEQRLDAPLRQPVTAALNSGATVFAGDYWGVWPGVFYANLVLVRSHSSSRVFGLASRSEATDPLWNGAGRSFLIAAPANDASVGAVAAQHGVAATLLTRQPGFDLYAGRSTLASR